MEVIKLTDFRQNMKAYFEKIINMSAPLFISRPSGKDIVLMSKEEYNSMQETFHLLKSPKNAERLIRSIEADQSDEGDVQQLVD